MPAGSASQLHPTLDAADLLLDPVALRLALGSWIPRGARVAIVDVPVNRNVGDLFIHAVTDWLLATLDCRVVYRAGVRDYDAATASRFITPGVIVLGLGGGNFGDLYPKYQALRERVVEDFPGNRVVVLPQTIRFERADAVRQAERRLARHGDLRIAVRDEPSAAFARRFTPHVLLLPDVVDAAGRAALAATGHAGFDGGAQPTARPGGTLRLLRRDAERIRRDRADGLDWASLLPGFVSRLACTAAILPVSPTRLSALVHDAWVSYGMQALRRAVERLRGYDHVVTDRLHGAILARLAACRVTLIDNANAKLSGYHDTWWRADPSIELLRTK